MTEKVRLLYNAESKTFREVNPLGEEPQRIIPFKHAGYYTERDYAALENFRKEKKAWLHAESTLRTFKEVDEGHELDLSFTIWYSGMEKEKVQKAYDRFKRETGYTYGRSFTREDARKIFEDGYLFHAANGLVPKESLERQFNDTLNSLHPYQEGVVYEGVIVGDGKIKIIKQ